MKKDLIDKFIDRVERREDRRKKRVKEFYSKQIEKLERKFNRNKLYYYRDKKQLNLIKTYLLRYSWLADSQVNMMEAMNQGIRIHKYFESIGVTV